MKLLRKVKGLWIAVALTGVVSTAALPVVTHAQVSDSQIAFVLSSELGSNFEGKSDLINDNIIKEEVKKALENASLIWQENTVEDIVEEVKRQEEAGLKAYVVQWGDTLSNIAEAVDKDVDKLIELNLIENPDLILTGDILDGVLNVESVTQSTSNNTPPSYDNNPVQEAEPSAPIPGDPNVDEPPAFEEAPEGETPDEDLESPVPETPDEPGIVEPDVPEEPGTDEPDVPEQPEVPETPETPEVPETPETPEVPETPETPEVPETPETPLEEGDTLVKERQWLDTTPEVVSTVANYEGRDGEEVINGEVSSAVQENSWEEQGEDVLTKETVVETVTETQIELVPETRIELVPETVIVQEPQDVLVGEDEEGNPIYETQLVDVEVTNMVETEITEMVEKELQVEVDVEVEKDVWVAGEIKYFNQVITTITQAYDQHIIYDSELDEGVVEVEQAGVNGVVTEVVTTVTEDGVVLDVVETSSVVSEMTPEIKRVGTRKHVSNTVVVNEHTVQEFGVIERATNSMYVGDTEISQVGVNGVRTVVKEQEVGLDGVVLTETVVSNNVLEPVDEIVLVGTKPIKGQKTVVNKVEIPFEVEVREVDSYNGEETVVQDGVKGIKEVTTIVHTEKGVEVGREVTGEVVTQAPVKQIVERGRANLESKEVQETESIDFNKTTRTNPDLPKGETKVVQEGVKGVKTSTYKVEYKNGVEVSRTLVGEEVTTPAVDEITEIGSKVKVETRQRTEEQVIKFKTVELGTDGLYVGESRVKQKGVNGVLEIVLEDTVTDGKVTATKEVKRQVKKEAVDQIVEVGTKPIKGQKTVVDKVEIPFEVEVREVDSYNDKDTVVQKGVKGIKEVTSIVHTEKGVEVSREVTGEVVTQAPVKQIVERGRANLETKEVQETESFDFNKTTITNPALPEGETKVVRVGVKGVKTSTYKVEYKDGVEVSRTLVSEAVTTPPVDEVTEIGSKVKVETRQRTEEQVIKFKTVETGTNDLYVGESRVKQKGVNGVLEIVLEDTITDGKVTATKEVKRQVKKEAVDQIVEVGTKTKVSSEEQQLNEIRNEFHRLLNEHRNQKGFHSLDYYEQFEDGADVRAYEVREGGGNFSHTRPDGSSQSTAYSDIKDVEGKDFVVGENILYRAWYDDQTTKEVAYEMFNQFKNSPGHYTNMMRGQYTGQALGLHVNEKLKSHYSWKYVSLAQALIETY